MLPIFLNFLLVGTSSKSIRPQVKRVNFSREPLGGPLFFSNPKCAVFLTGRKNGALGFL
jgi:hypothetical protein